MLAISNKISDLVEISKPLLRYCEDAFGPEAVGAVRPFALLVDELRAEALSANTPEGQRNGLRRYLGALGVVEDKFPIGQPLSVSTKVPFPSTVFTWSDSFRPRIKAKGSSVRFERACVLFNYAANQSLLARDTDRSTPEGQKLAVTLYQQAAGVFILLRDQLLPQCVAAGDSMGTDLSDGAVSMCASLMLAQAQALFYEKAVRDKSSKGLLAKLANQASNFYATAASLAAGLSDHLDPSWASHCRFQEILFLSAAHFQQAMSDKPNVVAKLSGFGALVARLRLARDLAASVAQIQNVGPSVVGSIAPLKDAIKAELTAMEYDNTNVYIELVPAADALAPIGLVPAVKSAAVSLPELTDLSYVEGHMAALDGLAPVELRRRAEWLDGETGKSLNKLNFVVAQLKVRTVPFPLTPGAAIVPVDARGNIEPISDELWSKIARIQVLGGPVALEGQLATLHGMTGECEGLLSYIGRALDEEERDDKNCRDRFGPNKFARTTSPELTGQFKTQLANYRQKLNLAVETNRKVRERIASQDKVLVSHLTRSRGELDAIWTERNQQAAREQKSVVNPATEALKTECRSKLEAMEVVVAEAKRRADILVSQYGPNSARLGEIIKSGDPEKFVTSVAEQAEKDTAELIGQVTTSYATANTDLDTAYNALLQHIGGDSSPRSSKGNWLIALDTCATIVVQGFGDVAEGVSFFNKLGDFLRKLKSQVDDFCFARVEEKAGILQNIQRSLAAANGNANSNANSNDNNPFGNSPQINFG